MNCVWLFVTLWIVACPVPLSKGFSCQQCWSGLLCPPPGDLPNPGMELAPLTLPALASRFFNTNANWEATCLPLLVVKKTQVSHTHRITKLDGVYLGQLFPVSPLCEWVNWGPKKESDLSEALLMILMIAEIIFLSVGRYTFTYANATILQGLNQSLFSPGNLPWCPPISYLSNPTVEIVSPPCILAPYCLFTQEAESPHKSTCPLPCSEVVCRR